MASSPKRSTDWRRRFDKAGPPKTIVLHTDFAGIKAGTVMFIGAPSAIANYIARIPAGETRSVERLRNELAHRNAAQATGPITTAFYLKVVAEVALDDLRVGRAQDNVIPFWRVIDPGSQIARRLSCEENLIADLRAMEAASLDPMTPERKAPQKEGLLSEGDHRRHDCKPLWGSTDTTGPLFCPYGRPSGPADG